MSKRTFHRDRQDLKIIMDLKDPNGKKSKKLITSKGLFSISIYAAILCVVMSILHLDMFYIVLEAMLAVACFVSSVYLWFRETQEWLDKHP